MGVQRRRLEEELSHKDEQLNEMRAQCTLLGMWREEEYAHITEDEKQRRYGQSLHEAGSLFLLHFDSSLLFQLS